MTNRAEELAEKCFKDEVAYCCDHCDDGPCDECLKKNFIKALNTYAEKKIEECARIAEDVYNLPTGVIIETHGFASDVGIEIAQAIRKIISNNKTNNIAN